MTTHRRRATLGLHQDAHGWRAWVWVDGANRSKRFPVDTPLSVMQAWRYQQRADAELQRVHTPRTGLAADARRYLAIVGALPTIAARTQMLEEWVTALGPERDRATVTTADVADVLARWQRERHYAASTLNHRRHALAHLYRILDPTAPNPVRGVPRAREPRPEPRGIAPRIVQAILDAMGPRDVAGRGSAPSRTAVQMRVLAMTGLPPATIGRLTPDHLATLDEGCVLVPGRRKGRGTPTTRHALTAEGIAALRHLAAVGAWGPIPSSTRLLVWRRAVRAVRREHPTWRIPADVRPYDLRHAYAELAYRATHDLALVQGLLGHAGGRRSRTRLGALAERHDSAPRRRTCAPEAASGTTDRGREGEAAEGLTGARVGRKNLTGRPITP